MMNKFTKAAIAGAAGIALLLGGAGSLAYWNSEAGLSGGTVSSGNLEIVKDGAPTAVEFAFNGGTPEAFNATTNKIVPGDVVTMTQGVTITAVGDHLIADLDIDKSSIVGNDLADAVTVSIIAYTSANAVVDTDGMDAAEAASIDHVDITITFDSATDGVVAQGLTLDLSNITLTLEQKTS